MKYLKSFNESLSEDQEINIGKDLKDICLELKDEGFYISVRHHYIPYSLKNNFTIIINKKWKGFDYSSVSEVVERLKDYMTNIGFKSSVKIPNKNTPGLNVQAIFLDMKTIEQRFGKDYLDRISDVKIEFIEK